MTSIHAQTVFDAATARQKAAEAEQLAADIAEFERKGGKVQRTGQHPYRPERHQPPAGGRGWGGSAQGREGR
ncbi:hypothetical protein V8017_16265 [Stenotrophomonas rhizophila]